MRQQWLSDKEQEAQTAGETTGGETTGGETTGDEAVAGETTEESNVDLEAIE